MVLTVVLIIFTLVLSVMSVGLYIWWKNYGKEIFKMFKNAQNMNQNMKNMGNLPKFGNYDEFLKKTQEILNKRR